MSEDWLVRRAVPEDEDCIAGLWLRSLCRSQTALDYKFAWFERDRWGKNSWKGSGETRTPEQLAWWRLQQPIVTGLIRHASVSVLCDPERAEYSPGQPAVIWGWVVAAGDVVYGLGVKNEMRKAGYGRDIARDLLGDRLDREQVIGMELVDLQRLRLVPEAWTIDRTWWAAMMTLSGHAEEPSSVAALTAAHVINPHRVPWEPVDFRRSAA